MRISDWSSDVCSSDLPDDCVGGCVLNIPFTWDEILTFDAYAKFRINERFTAELTGLNLNNRYYLDPLSRSLLPAPGRTVRLSLTGRSEEHTSELQSLMRTSYAVF